MKTGWKVERKDGTYRWIERWLKRDSKLNLQQSDGQKKLRYKERDEVCLRDREREREERIAKSWQQVERNIECELHVCLLVRKNAEK